MMPMNEFVYWAEREISGPIQLIRIVRHHLDQVSKDERIAWLNSNECFDFCLRHGSAFMSLFWRKENDPRTDGRCV